MRAQGIADRGKYNRDISGCCLCSPCRQRSQPGDKHVWLASYEFAGQCRQLFGPPIGRAIIDRDVFTSGNAAAAPPTRPMNSRRLMLPSEKDRASCRIK
jgi:hypothetical protein